MYVCLRARLCEIIRNVWKAWCNLSVRSERKRFESCISRIAYSKFSLVFELVFISDLVNLKRSQWQRTLDLYTKYWFFCRKFIALCYRKHQWYVWEAGDEGTDHYSVSYVTQIIFSCTVRVWVLLFLRQRERESLSWCIVSYMHCAINL
jgi:hypothetical protein